MTDQLLSPTFLFRFSVPCAHRDAIWDNTKGVELDDACRLPSFGAELEGRPNFADVRAAWNKGGISFTVRVAGKKQPPWCRNDRCEDSDGLQVWVDTRDTHNLHRATRFCHRFVFMPAGDGPKFADPVAAQLLINRARENAPPVPPAVLEARAEKRVDGYILQGHIPAKALAGFAPAEHPRLGFFYAVIDRELGWQTLGVDNAFPFDEDPSVWGTLELAS